MIGYVGGPFPVYRPVLYLLPVLSRPVPSRPVASSHVWWMCIREKLSVVRGTAPLGRCCLLPVGAPIWEDVGNQ